MKFKDKRLKLVNDMLTGIKVLKLYTWEIPMQKMIAKLRAKELMTLRKLFILKGFVMVSLQLAPTIVNK